MGTTSIEWAHESANAAGGCTEARYADGTMSPECAHCYARLQSARMPGLMGANPTPRKARIADLYDGVAERAGRGARWTGVLRWDRELLADVFDRLRPGKRTFLGSMTDLWHADHDPALGVALAGYIRDLAAQPSRYHPEGLILLTKRADRQLAWQREHFPEGLPAFVWPGVTAGTQRSADERLPFATQLRASVIAVSAEPLLGPVDLDRWLRRRVVRADEVLTERMVEAGWSHPGGDGDHQGLQWVIAGAESGIGRRPTDPAWLRSLRDQCVAAGVPYFLKQMEVDGAVVGTPELDGRTWTEVPRG